jgi:DNA invertase Pin-like site-specific DNA recombinase
MLGFDRDHPVVKGSALVSTIVPRALLEQRAWAEASRAFEQSNQPTVEDIDRLLQTHGNKRQVAKILGIGLSTVYKILGRGGRLRKRNFFGKSQ